MPYVILTERSKTKRPDMSAPIYYSRLFGCFSCRDQADEFVDFDSAQPKVRELRNAGQVFTYAVEVR